MGGGANRDYDRTLGAISGATDRLARRTPAAGAAIIGLDDDHRARQLAQHRLGGTARDATSARVRIVRVLSDGDANGVP